MRSLSILVLIALSSIGIIAQESSSQRRNEIVASFNKEKYLAKEKYGVRVEKYKKVVSEPAIKQNLSEYSGIYRTEGLEHSINLQVAADGTVKANGSETTDGITRSFKLQGARIAFGMLTATKVYDDGSQQKFEGVFLNRTDFISPKDPGVKMFGLGVVVSNPVEIQGVALDKLFYQLKP